MDISNHTVLVTDDAFESYVFKLESLLRPINDFCQMLEGEEPPDDEAMDEVFERIARILGKKETLTDELSKERAWLSLGAEHALDSVYVLIASRRLKRYGEKAAPASDMLMRVVGQNVGLTEKNRAEFMEEVPFMVETALDSLLQDGIYEKDPTGGPAIAGRILASMRVGFDRLKDDEPAPDSV